MCFKNESTPLLPGMFLATSLAAQVVNPIQAAQDAYTKAGQQQQASAQPAAASAMEDHAHRLYPSGHYFGAIKRETEQEKHHAPIESRRVDSWFRPEGPAKL